MLSAGWLFCNNQELLGWSFHCVVNVDFSLASYLIQSISSTEHALHFTVLNIKNMYVIIKKKDMVLFSSWKELLVCVLFFNFYIYLYMPQSRECVCFIYLFF